MITLIIIKFSLTMDSIYQKKKRFFINLKKKELNIFNTILNSFYLSRKDNLTNFKVPFCVMNYKILQIVPTFTRIFFCILISPSTEIVSFLVDLFLFFLLSLFVDLSLFVLFTNTIKAEENIGRHLGYNFCFLHLLTFFLNPARNQR